MDEQHPSRNSNHDASGFDGNNGSFEDPSVEVLVSTPEEVGGEDVRNHREGASSLAQAGGSHPPDGIDEDLLSRHRRRSHGSSLQMTVPPVTRHRKELERIVQDSLHQTKYAVPDTIPEAMDAKGKLSSLLKPQPHLRKLSTLHRRLQWIAAAKTYSASKLKRDLVAGITVAILAIPLGMSYARLAGLPAYYGLYGSFVPPLVYPVFGSSHHLGVGPAALISLLVSQGVGKIVDGQALASEEEKTNLYTSLAIQCSFLAGLLNLGLGICRLGFVAQFLSRAVISGFTSGASIIIASSQLQHILGYAIPSSNKLHKILRNLFARIGQFHWQPFLLGCACIAVLVTCKNLAQNEKAQQKYKHIKWLRALSPIAVSCISIALVYGLDLEHKHIRIVGTIPAGLPSVTIAEWTPINSELWVTVVSMVIVGFVQSVAIAKRIAYRRGTYEIDPSQELVSLGMCSLIGGMFQSYPPSGAIGQSVVNDEIGAETGFASIVTGLVVMLVLLLLTPVFEYMPLAVLASIVISFVLSMFDYPEAIFLFRVHKFDFTVWMAAFLGTLFLGVDYGLGIAVGISLTIVIYESAYPHTAVLGRLPGTTLYRNIKQYEEADEYDGVVIVRIDAPIYFANALNVRDKIRRYKQKALEELKERSFAADGSADRCNNNGNLLVQYIVLDLSPVSHIDTTGLHMLEDMYKTQKGLDTQLCLSNPGIQVAERLNKCGVADTIGRQHIFPSVIDAVQWCLHDMDAKQADSTCPEEP